MMYQRLKIKNVYFKICILLGLCYGCCSSAYYNRVDCRNLYVSDLYYLQKRNITKGQEQIEDDEEGQIKAMPQKSVIAFGLGLRKPRKDMYNITLTNVIFYHKDKSCPIFSYTREELLKIKINSGFKENEYDGIFIVTKTGLKIISYKEYEVLKNNIKPEDIITDIPCNKDLIAKTENE